MNGGHALSLQGLFFAARKKAAHLNPFVKYFLQKKYPRKSTLPITFFDAWEGSPLG